MKNFVINLITHSTRFINGYVDPDIGRAKKRKKERKEKKQRKETKKLFIALRNEEFCYSFNNTLNTFY